MIAPTKGIAPDRALLTVGAQIAMVLREPLTVSQTWSRLRAWRQHHGYTAPISFDWFVLALDVLFALGTLEFDGQVLIIRRADVPTFARR